MQHVHDRVPVCLITGATGAGKSTLIRALAAARPPAERWAVLNNDTGASGIVADYPALNVASIGGCACCTGQVLLRTSIVKLLRETRPALLLIEASAAAEPAALSRALQEQALARAIELRVHFCMAAATWTALPPRARDLLRRQMSAADYRVARDAAAATALRAALPAAEGAGGNVIQFDDAIRLVLDGPAAGSSASSRRISS